MASDDHAGRRPPAVQAGSTLKDRGPAHLGERLDVIQRVMPHAQRVVMPRRDHGANLKHPKDVARVIEGVLILRAAEQRKWTDR